MQVCVADPNFDTARYQLMFTKPNDRLTLPFIVTYSYSQAISSTLYIPHQIPKGQKNKKRTCEKSQVQTLASSVPSPKSISTSKSSCASITLALSSSIGDSGSPFVSSRRGDWFWDFLEGRKETDILDGVRVVAGRGV